MSDSCHYCGVLEQIFYGKKITLSCCMNCDEIVCNNCVDKRNRCPTCAEYNWPLNVKIIKYEDIGKIRANNGIILRICIDDWIGHGGKHYHVEVKEYTDYNEESKTELLSEKYTSTKEIAKAINDLLKTKFSRKDKLFLYFREHDTHKWFYREGD